MWALTKTTCCKIFPLMSNEHQDVQDCTFEFTSSPLQPLVPKESNFSSKECLEINSDLLRLLDKGVFIYSEHVPHDFISSIFGKPKNPKCFRMKSCLFCIEDI